MKLLIVEDNPLIAEAVEVAGKQLRFQTELATDGWDAIDKLHDQRYDAIVIDTDLARRSGFGVLAYLREERGDRLDNVILISADREDVRRRTDHQLPVIRRTEVAGSIRAAMTSVIETASSRS